MITVRYFAGARAAAGVAEEKVSAETLEELIRVVSDAHGPALEKVLGVASFLVNEVVSHDRRAPLPADTSVDVLPPFAGG